MGDRVIDNPIINSPYQAPRRHFEFDDDGITDRIVEGRRPSSYFVPVPQPRKRGRQLQLADLTAEQIELNDRVNGIRRRVEAWRFGGYPNVTPTTRTLLDFWSDPERDNPVLFCQRDAAETAIYVVEAAGKTGDTWIRNELAEANREHNDGLARMAVKMATGTGKTVVMAMLIAWQTLNKVASPRDARFTKRFLVVTPGITIRDRLRVLLPVDPDNYYRLRDLVPADLYGALHQAKIVITNFHAFQRGEIRWGGGGSKTTKEMLTEAGRPSPFQESWGHMVNRVCRELGGSTEIVVFNDEAHHCYRGRLDDPDPEADADAGTLAGDEKKSVNARNAQARVWFTGLRAIDDKLGIKTVFDLSATPFFLAGSGCREGTLFPWVVSDYSLIDAIEAGVVKIPRVPVDDDRVSPDVTYLHLWPEIADQLPKKGRREGTVSPEALPSALEGALTSLYDSYERSFRDWEQSDAARDGDPPPVFIVVCSNTTVSKMVYDFIAGWERAIGEAGQAVLVPGRLPLFSNVENGAWRHRPRAILIDSEQLESEEGLSARFKRIAAVEIEEFRREYAQRFPGRSADDIDDAEILREVMNTVGKRGKLGEHVRCVVSVSMLTEGWDANTVTHILGVRAFGTQLLCEQVVGRGLRRRSYATDEHGFFTPEYADVYGVPFQFIPTVAKTRDLDLKPTRRVRAEPDRAHAQITFPRLAGYRIELPDEPLHADFDDDSRLVLSTADLPTTTEVSGIAGSSSTHTLEGLRAKRNQEIAFELAKLVLERHVTDSGDPQPWRFPEVLAIAKAWLASCVDCHDGTFPGLLLLGAQADRAASRIFGSILRQPENRAARARVVPMFRPFDHIGSTAEVDFFTTKQVYPTLVERCHVNLVVLDGPFGNTWERVVAQALEALPEVAAYVKNDHLGFAIPYALGGQTRQYLPDFLVRLRDRGDGEACTLIVEVSGGRKPPGITQEKAAAARTLWLPAVNNHGGFGRWSYCEITDPTQARSVLSRAIDALYRRIGASAVAAPE
ncbi:MAG: BPTD_3080 family restriction endonuclease [Egibacteraceae bacterium]